MRSLSALQYSTSIPVYASMLAPRIYWKPSARKAPTTAAELDHSAARRTRFSMYFSSKSKIEKPGMTLPNIVFQIHSDANTSTK